MLYDSQQQVVLSRGYGSESDDLEVGGQDGVDCVYDDDDGSGDDVGGGDGDGG